MQDMRDREEFVELWNMFKPSEKYIFSLRMDNPKCGECGCMECMVWDVSKNDCSRSTPWSIKILMYRTEILTHVALSAL